MDTKSSSGVQNIETEMQVAAAIAGAIAAGLPDVEIVVASKVPIARVRELRKAIDSTARRLVVTGAIDPAYAMSTLRDTFGSREEGLKREVRSLAKERDELLVENAKLRRSLEKKGGRK